MKRLDTHIGSVDTALQQAPEVFEAVGMDAPVDVFDGVVNNPVRVVGRQTLVGKQRVSVERRARFDMLFDFRLQDSFLAAGNNGSANASAALQDAHDGGLIFGSCASDAALANAQVHIAGFAADESLIGFDFAAQLATKGIILHGKPDAMQHEPCGFLSHLHIAGDFVGTDAILAIGDEPSGNQPFIEANRRISR